MLHSSIMLVSHAALVFNTTGAIIQRQGTRELVPSLIAMERRCPLKNEVLFTKLEIYLYGLQICLSFSLCLYMCASLSLSLTLSFLPSSFSLLISFSPGIMEYASFILRIMEESTGMYKTIIVIGALPKSYILSSAPL